MNNKMIGMTAVYAIFMGILLVLTFNYNWNPSGYSYTLDQNQLTIQQGITDADPTTVDGTDQMANVLLFQAAVSEVNSHWHTDIIMMALFFPFVLFMIFKDIRPFQNLISYKWFAGIVSAIILIYVVATVPSYVSQIQAVEDQVGKILEF